MDAFSSRVRYTKFKELRLKAGITQYQLAELIGVKQGAISQWETKDRVPKNRVGILCEIFNVPMSEIPCGHNKTYK